MRKSFYSLFMKRCLDFIFALILFVIAIPFILIAMLLIRIDSPGSPVFKQERIGYRCRKFTIYKLRTMDTRSHDANGQKIRDRDRVTKVGRIIRKLSIDELPQLWNIIKGDMSFVGPRPLLTRYFPYYTEIEVQRHQVRPGITGLAQVNGRSDLQWEKRFAYDVNYVKNISFALDCKIIFATIKKVLTHENTSTIRPEGLVDFDVHRQQDPTFVMRDRKADPQ